MTWKAAIAGASGYAGGELLRLLSGHPEFEIGQVSASGSAGRSVGDLHPHLPHLADRAFVPASTTQWLDHDFVFVALPHGQSAGLVAQLPDSLPVVDLGADYRLRDPAAWNDYYGGAHAGSWVYGMPELAEQRSPIAASHHVANPGCYPTAVTLSIAPLLASGFIDGSDVVVVAASGTSGAGRGAKPALLGVEVMGSVSAYKAAGSHQHTPEMEQALSAAAGWPVTVSFTPMLAPMPRGILSTTTLRVRDGVTAADIRETTALFYRDEPFVHLLEEGRWPRTGDVFGSNCLHLQVDIDARAGRVIAVAAIDNLIKGAAGQAIQNANLMLGLDETLGLSPAGVAP